MDATLRARLAERARLTRRAFLARSALLAGAVGAAAWWGEGVPAPLLTALAAQPSGIDPGPPVYAGPPDPVPPEPAPFDPRRSMLGAIQEADLDGGGSSFWFDRVLERPFLSAADSWLFTRGRALYMYTHDPAKLGFGGGYAYRERPTGGDQDLYTLAVDGFTLTEESGSRTQWPSHWSSVHVAPGLRVAETKFITHENAAVTILTITNTGTQPIETTLRASSPLTSAPSAGGDELTGTVTARYGLTTLQPRLAGDGMTAGGSSLTRTLALEPGRPATVKVVMGVLAGELPGSSREYARYRQAGPEEALRSHLRDYNQWWVDNVPYVDLPDQNVKKMSYYRAFLNRFNFFDGDIPGNDYQFPVDIEGVLGYNNAIQLTVCMRMQDLKWFRDPLWSYGPWTSSGESSGGAAFHDNPGDTAHWNNTYEQYIGREAWRSYQVHGGQRAILGNLAHYIEGDVRGQLAKFDGNQDSLIEYAAGFLTGNDADAVALAFFGRAQDRTETAFWWAGARAAAEIYALLGDGARAQGMEAIAGHIQEAILTRLWDDGPDRPFQPAVRVPGVYGTAIALDGATQYVSLPAGIVGGLHDFTVAAWVNPAAITTWSRVFDFGTGTGVYMFLTVSAGPGPRFAITTGGGAGEQVLQAPAPLPTGQWSHLAVTLSGTTATLYVDGTPAATNAAVTLNPAALGATTQNWIGRSQFSDPLLDGAVDDFQIYDRALGAGEVRELATRATEGAGNVAWYKFDEPGGTVAADSSGHGRNGTIIGITGVMGGKVFKQRDVLTGTLVPWKDQQNFSPFTEGLVPATDRYEVALRYYADPAEFPIMPFFTADQHDKAEAAAAGKPGSNNFSNINATLQAQLYSRALRDYPSSFITPQMYRRLIEWLSWTQYIGGDNRWPDNNEFYFNYDPQARTLGRSFIHHDVLGAYNFMLVEDIAGLRPRLDETVELWPVDMGYAFFAVNNLRYHGSDLTIVWQRPGGPRRYRNAPFGYSLYLDGRRVCTVDKLVHLRWDARTGATTILEGGGATVRFSAPAPLRHALDVDLSGNARVVDVFQKAGVDLSRETGRASNLARGKTVAASFTTTSPPLQRTAPENAVDGFTISGLPVMVGSYVALNPIWGTLGSPNSQDWFEVDLGAPVRVNCVKLYFYSNKEFGTSGGTYREPSAYTVQHLVGTSWVEARGQEKTPSTPTPNYNRVVFAPLTTRRLRVLMTPTSGFGMGLKEIQVFDLVER